MKPSDPISNHLNKKLKLHREAEFYNYLKREKVDFEHCKFAGVYVAVPDENTGRFILLMEYIDGTVNMFKAFGEWQFKQRPDLDRPISLGGVTTSVLELSRFVAKALGEMHAKFWMNKEFLEANKSWVARAPWFQGKDLKGYVESVGMIKSIWQYSKKRISKGCVTHKWDPKVKAIIDSSFDKATEEGFKAHFLREGF